MSFSTADSQTQHKHLPDDDDVLGALRFITLWDREKIQLVEALKDLASDEFLVSKLFLKFREKMPIFSDSFSNE